LLGDTAFMRIGIDNVSPGQATSKQGPGGMRMYLQALTSEFARLAPEDQFVLFTPRRADPVFDGPPPPNVTYRLLAGVPTNRPLRTCYQQTLLASAVERAGLAAFFATATIAPLLVRIPVVLAVQFLQFYTMPEFYGRLRTAYLRLFLPLSVARARVVITFTETARRDLIRYTRADPTKVVVIPHGLNEEVWAPPQTDGSLGRKLTGGRPFLFYPSATYGYKNHLRLIQAFALLKQQYQLPHVLLLVGGEGGVSHRALREAAAAAGVGAEVIVAGRLERVVPLYHEAAVTVMPSLYETFGYPVLEAMACGCPVVTSNLGSMAELAGDAAVLVDPYDPASIADGLARVLLDPALRAQLVERGRQRAQPFRWSRTAQQTLALLHEAAHS
jgi:glycosyltransferase involved in cell wall biosynthesis